MFGIKNTLRISLSLRSTMGNWDRSILDIAFENCPHVFRMNLQLYYQVRCRMIDKYERTVRTLASNCTGKFNEQNNTVKTSRLYRLWHCLMNWFILHYTETVIADIIITWIQLLALGMDLDYDWVKHVYEVSILPNIFE